MAEDPNDAQSSEPPFLPPAQTTVAAGPDRKSPDQRKQLLAQQIQMASVRGRRVESQQDYQAVLIEGKPVNHTLHAILTVFTCLVWSIVWIVLVVTGGEKRELVVIDEWGNVQYQKLGAA